MGPSAAGKSTLAKHLESAFPERFARVPVDFFFIPRPAGQPLPAFLNEPLAYDWPLLDRALGQHGSERTTPTCDFEQMRRRSATGGLPIGEAPVYVLDGMRPHPACDVVMMLELDRSEQIRRLNDRDERWKTAVANRKAHLEATFRAGCAELVEEPTLRLQASGPLEQNAAQIIAALSQ